MDRPPREALEKAAHFLCRIGALDTKDVRASHTQTHVSHEDTWTLAHRLIALRNWLTWAESWQWCRCIHCALGDDWSVSFLIHWCKDAQGAVHCEFRYAYCLNMSFEFECTAEILSLELQTTFVSILSLAPGKYCSKKLIQGMLVLAPNIEASFLCCQQMPRSLRHQSSVWGWDGNVFRNSYFVQVEICKNDRAFRETLNWRELCDALLTTFAASLEFPPRCSDKGIWAWGRRDAVPRCLRTEIWRWKYMETS